MQILDIVRQFIIRWILPLGLFLFLTALTYASSRGAYKAIVTTWAVFPALILMATDGRQRIIKYFSEPVSLLLLILLLYLLISTIWSDGSEKPEKMVKYALHIFAFTYLIAARDHFSKLQLLRILALSSIVITLWAAWSIVSYYGIDGHNLGQHFLAGNAPLYNTLLSGHFVGFYGVFVISLLILYWQGLNVWQRLLTIACLSIILIFMILNGSRSPLLSLTLAIFVLLFFTRSYRTVITVSLLSLLAWLFFVFYFNALERGTSFRLEIWSYALARIKEALFFGHGLGSNYKLVLTSSDITFYDPHNMHLAIFYYGGVLAFLLWGFILVRCVTVLVMTTSEKFSLLILTLFIFGMSQSCFEGGYLISKARENWFILWLPLALALKVLLDRPSLLATNQQI